MDTDDSGDIHTRGSPRKTASSVVRLLTPAMDPEIEDAMQEGVGKERANARSLRRAVERGLPLAALGMDGRQRRFLSTHFRSGRANWRF
jgi:hypothetical protein